MKNVIKVYMKVVSRRYFMLFMHSDRRACIQLVYLLN